MHVLGLYIDDCECDCRILKITDISIYDSEMDVTNRVLKINIPGNNNCDYLPPFPKSGTGFYSSNTFGITAASCGEGLISLPDGIYTITYSVCPNEQVFTTEKVLRTCTTRCLILNQLSNILKGNCNNIVVDGYGNDITSKRVQDLKDLLILLDTAKSDVKVHKDDQAEEKLLYVSKKLNSFSKF